MIDVQLVEVVVAGQPAVIEVVVVEQPATIEITTGIPGPAGGDNYLVNDANTYTAYNLGIGTDAAPSAVKLEVNGALKISGETTGTFITPGNAWVPTKINIPLYSPDDYGQILALGMGVGAPVTARCISLLDARASTHQPTLVVFNPAEDDVIGLSWDGSNTTANVKTLAANLSFKSGSNTLLTLNTDSYAAAAGGLGLAQNTITLANGLNSDIDAARASWIRITGPTAAFSVGGIASPADGRVLLIFNATTQAMTIVNDDSSSTAVNRILTLTGANVVLTSPSSAATLMYSATDNKWILVSFNAGTEADIRRYINLKNPDTGFSYQLVTPSGTTTLNTTGFQNKIVAAPVYIGATKTFTKLVIYSSTSIANAVAGVGIYSNTTSGSFNNLPDALLFSYESIAVSSTGLKVFTINLTLSPGLYWFAINCSSASQGIKALSTSSSPLGWDYNFYAILAYSGTNAYTDTMPSTFPAIAVLNSSAPFIGFA